MTLQKEDNEIVTQEIPYTFDKQGRERLQKSKVESLDIFFLIIAQELKDEEEIYTLNH